MQVLTFMKRKTNFKTTLNEAGKEVEFVPS